MSENENSLTTAIKPESAGRVSRDHIFECCASDFFMVRRVSWILMKVIGVPAPDDYATDRSREVDARWALLRLKHCEPLAARYESLQQEEATAEVRARIKDLRRRYVDLAGIEPERRRDVRHWLRGLIPDGPVR